MSGYRKCVSVFISMCVYSLVYTHNVCVSQNRNATETENVCTTTDRKKKETENVCPNAENKSEMCVYLLSFLIRKHTMCV